MQVLASQPNDIDDLNKSNLESNKKPKKEVKVKNIEDDGNGFFITGINTQE
jgi:hypothetical protein